jgi:hypothetical protein
MLIFLVIIFLGINIACGVSMAIPLKYLSAGKFILLTCRMQLIGRTLEELVLSGMYYVCYHAYRGDPLLLSIFWIFNTVWEVLALCLSVWIAVKHFRDLRRLGPSTGSTIGDLFRVLIQSHVIYFAR